MATMNIGPVRVDIVGYENDKVDITCNFYTDAAQTATLNVSTWTFVGTFKTASGTDYAASIDTTDAATGTVVVTLSAANAANFDPRQTHFWDLKRTDADKTLYHGYFTVGANLAGAS